MKELETAMKHEVRLIVPYMSVLIYPCDGITGEGTVSQEYSTIIVLIRDVHPVICGSFAIESKGLVHYLRCELEARQHVYGATVRHCLYPSVILRDKKMMEPATCVQRW